MFKGGYNSYNCVQSGKTASAPDAGGVGFYIQNASSGRFGVHIVKAIFRYSSYIYVCTCTHRDRDVGIDMSMYM